MINLKIDILGKKKSFTMDEARELYNELDVIFSKPQPFPYVWPYYLQYPNYTTPVITTTTMPNTTTEWFNATSIAGGNVN